MKNYGLIIPEIQADNYVLGGVSSVPKEVLALDGQWTRLPLKEYQNLNNVETSACATFHTLNPIETLIIKRYGLEENYSDRWLAWNSGTTEEGNDPHMVAETLRKAGVPEQKEWDFEKDIYSFDEFYKNPPPNLFEKARKFLEKYEFMHEWVDTDPEAMMQALQYSPLGISVYAWVEENGLFVKPQGVKDNHWVTCVGYIKNKYWIVFDSYDNVEKHLAWNYGSAIAKRYWIKKKEETKEEKSQEGVIRRFINWLLWQS